MIKPLRIKAACLSALCLPALSFAMSVQYFGLIGKPPMQSTKTTSVCLLDKASIIKAEIYQDLKKQRALKQMSASDITARYENQFKAVSKNVICQYEAAKLGVTSLPAIVINHRYVIYGQYNIDSGVREYQAYLERDHVQYS